MSSANAFVIIKSAQFQTGRLKVDLLGVASTIAAGGTGVRMLIVMLNKHNGMSTAVSLAHALAI